MPLTGAGRIPGELEAEITPFDTCKAVSGEQEAFSPPDDIERAVPKYLADPGLAVFASKYTASPVALMRNSLGLELRFVADKVCASVPPNASSAEWQKAYPASGLWGMARRRHFLPLSRAAAEVLTTLRTFLPDGTGS